MQSPVRAVKPTPRSQRYDGNGADSGSSRGDPCRLALRPKPAPASIGTAPSARANPDPSRSAPHCAGRKAEAEDPVRGRDKRQEARSAPYGAALIRPRCARPPSPARGEGKRAVVNAAEPQPPVVSPVKAARRASSSALSGGVLRSARRRASRTRSSQAAARRSECCGPAPRARPCARRRPFRPVRE